ncbi:MAG TPA: hypothetical protein VH142_23185, partial [Polyangiaceae bacterium]|jgi:hypothetical protein|nr:hypothetical protein [Polyangiaceae bacterium]
MHKSLLVLLGIVAACEVGCSSANGNSEGEGSQQSGTGGENSFGNGGATNPFGSGGSTAVGSGGGNPFGGAGGVSVGSGGNPFGGGGIGPVNTGGSPFGGLPGSGGDIGSTGGSPFGSGGDIGSTGGFGNGGNTGSTGGAPPGSGGTTTTGTPGQPMLPAAPTQMCPTFTNGGVVQIQRASGTNVPVTVYIDPAAKSKPAPGGPLIIYWHATLSSPTEVHQGFGDTNIAAVTAAGGVVAAPATTACSGCTTTDDGYWFVEDDVVLDTIVSCAIAQANIDVTHIHTLGWSAGALHTTHVAQARSNYIASFISYSGGLYLLPSMDQNPANKVAGILTYGDPGSDDVILDFNAQSLAWYKQFQPEGWYSMMCHHPGGHEIDPEVAPHSLEFFKAHPFEVSPEPYATTIPSDFPSYCSNMSH